MSDQPTTSTLTDIEQSTFKAIVAFVTSLGEIFSSSHHELELYDRLIQKTTLKHEMAVRKNIEAFRLFCLTNKNAITTRSYSDLSGTIVYSPNKVFIDVKKILETSDEDTRKVIWLHLLKILAFIDPTTKAREILKENASNESNLIDEIMTKVEANVDLKNTNPLEAVTSIMNSGIFNDLMMGMNNKLQDGSIDLGKLMGTVENLCSNMKGDFGKGGGGGGGGGPDGADLFKIFQTVVAPQIQSLTPAGATSSSSSEPPVVLE
jgi:hypothetical protein